MSDLIRQVAEDLTGITFDPGSPSHTAEWFRLEHADLIPVRYVENIGWHTWDGKAWQPDPEGLRCKALVASFIKMLNQRTFGQSYNKKYTVEKAYIANVESALQLSTLTAAADMDALPSYLNCQNGVLDLTTFKLEPHDPDLNLTMITRAEYIEDIDPLWSEFIEEILPDEQIRRYLQRLVGVSLLGEVLLHTLPILQGSGANGKSTMMNAMIYALGSYGYMADSNLLMTGAGDAHAASPATMALRGRRLVVTSETEDGKKLASAFVKQITGGDLLTARALYKGEVSWKPTHSAFMLTNHMPVVDGSDKALFRRLKVVPFSVIVPPDKMDPELPNKLERLCDSILSWAVAGLKDYRENGIQEPAVVTGATDDYRGENDALSTFVSDNLEFGVGTTPTSELTNLLHSFQQDADPRNRITNTRLNRALRENGATEGRIRIDGVPTRVWNGVKIKD